MPSRSRFANRSSTRFVLGAVAGAAVAALLERRRRPHAEAQREAVANEREAEAARLASQLVTAEQDERRRLSLALHDGPLQSLSGIVLMHDAVLRGIREQSLDDAARVLETSIARERTAIRELRDLSFAMEPIVLRDHGFEAAMVALADQVRLASAIQVDLDVADGERLGPKAQVGLYQALREAISQAGRRKPGRIEVELVRAGDGSIVATVADNGVLERRSGGIEEIRGRARILNGRADLEPRERGGTVVRIEVPGYTAAI